jgi:hypothetical protein
VSATTLVQTLQQLGAAYPVQVYDYVADTLRRGERANLPKPFGFHMPPKDAT